MRISRYLDLQAFRREVQKLKVWDGYLSDTVFERLEEQRSLVPKLRLRYPDAIERRWWKRAEERYERSSDYYAEGPLEPDGERWEAACSLEAARTRFAPFEDPTVVPHPLDDPEERFRQFITCPASLDFTSWEHFRVQVAEGPHGPLFESNTVVTYYSSWQILLFAEVAKMGVTSLMNIQDVGWPPSDQMLLDAPQVSSFDPARAIRGFSKHEQALDAIVWFTEEAQRGELYATQRDHGRRILLETERNEIMRTRVWAAEEAQRRHDVKLDDLLAAISFLAERWSYWQSLERPAVTRAYKSILFHAVRLTCLIGDLSYKQLRDQIGRVGGWFKPILDVIWRDWKEEQRARARATLLSFNRDDAILPADVTEALIDEFLSFLEDRNLHSFYWRLSSFNHHTFKGNDYALEAMRADLQGMALVVEHLAEALGAEETQLYEKFKKLWAEDRAVLKCLKNNEFRKAGGSRNRGIDLDWHKEKQEQSEAHSIAADLAIAYAVRGGAHRPICEDNPFMLERMMLIILRAAVKTFEVATDAAQKRAAAEALS